MSVMRNDHRLYKVLVAPVISEKATVVGESFGQVVFKIAPDATKLEVKAAVEAIFNVKVDSVRVLNQQGKVKRFKGRIGRRASHRKAYITLVDGQQINLESEA